MTSERYNELLNRYITDYNMTEAEAIERLWRDTKLSLAKSHYDTMIDELSLSQFTKLMGNDFSMVSRAAKAKKLSKSKNVHFCANCILYLLNNDKSGLDALQIDNINKHIDVRLGHCD